MANFTEEIKKEIISDTVFENQCCRIAFLSAFLRTSGSVLSRNGEYGFEVITENEDTALFVKMLFYNTFGIELLLCGVQRDLKSGRDKYKLEYITQDSFEILKRL